MKSKTILILLTLTIILSMSLVSADNTTQTNKTCIYVFYLDGCPHCINLDAYIKTIENNYSLDIKRLNANANPELLKNLSQYYKVPKQNWGAVPIIFLGDYYCLGDKPCILALESYFKKYQSTGVDCIIPEVQQTQVSIKEITGLALVNSINPCALAVLILILTTILLRYPDQKKKVLQAGLAFSLAIFISYIVIGIIIVLGFKSISNIASGTLWIKRIIGSLSILLGILNVKDFFFYKQGSFATEMPLAWRPRMKRLVTDVTSTRGVFIIGILITLFLVPCTSGPYFIAGGILANLSWNSIISWLVYYNLIFILPAILITLIIYSGLVRAEHVSNWRERNIKRIHLIAGLILIIIGIQILTGWGFLLNLFK